MQQIGGEERYRNHQQQAREIENLTGRCLAIGLHLRFREPQSWKVFT